MESKQWTKLTAPLLINLLVAFLIPIATDRLTWTSGATSIFLGALIAVLLTSVEILYYVKLISEAKESELKLWAARGHFEASLTNIREAFARILQSRRDTPDLFENFFHEQLLEFEKTIVEAANKDELHLERGHIVRMNDLLATFKGTSEDCFRAVHFVEDNDFLFDIYAKQYFYKINEMAQQRRITHVRRLVLYEKAEDLTIPESIRLLAFHHFNEHFEARIMKKEHYFDMAKDFKLGISRDFGVYGNRLVYVAVANVKTNIQGYWIRNIDRVRVFSDFFDQCWNSPATGSIPDELLGSYKGMTINQLFSQLPDSSRSLKVAAIKI